MKKLSVRIPARDGAELATDVYLPDEQGPRPALIQRTPYGKELPAASLTFDASDGVARGYAVVIQDCRGCGASDGHFHALVDERDDGHDTIEWVAQQEWCDGRVGVYGSSYMGAAALQAAIDAPPPLRVAMVYLTAGSYQDDWVWRGGAFELGFGIRWSLEQADRLAERFPDPGAIHDVVARFHADQTAYVASTFDLEALTGPAEMPHWREWLEHPDPTDEYWRALDVVRAADEGRLAVPLLQVAGLYDAFMRSQLALHRALRGDKLLVIGPWDHAAYMAPEASTTAGSKDFGPDAAGGRVGVGPLAFAWFDHWFRDADHGLPPVRYFAIGPHKWREAPEWPPAGATQRWYLHENGVLSTSEPEAESVGTFTHDPNSPAPTIGGRHLVGWVPSGVQDQRPLIERDDVLVFRSDPFAEPLTIAGPVRLRITISSSAPAGDVVVTLLDIAPSGEAWNIADGVSRLVPFDGTETVELGDASYEIGVEHRLGLCVAGCSFPRYDRIREHAVGAVVHDPAHPSALELHVVPDSDLP